MTDTSDKALLAIARQLDQATISPAIAAAALRAVVAERANDADALDAAAIQRMAAGLVQDAAAHSAYLSDDGESATLDEVASAILAIPLPTPADRLAEAMALPEVKALVEAARKVHDSYWYASDGVISGMYDLERALRAMTGEARHE